MEPLCCQCSLNGETLIRARDTASRTLEVGTKETGWGGGFGKRDENTNGDNAMMQQSDASVFQITFIKVV